MTFDYPWLLLLLVLAVPSVLLWIRSVKRRRERIRRFTESEFADKLILGNRPRLRRWHFILFFAAFLLIIAAATGPLVTGGKEKVQVSGIDIMIVLDVSNSMRARDIQPSRLERAKLALTEAINTMGEDRIGMVVFAGHPYTSLPLTDDRSAAEMVVESVTTEMAGVQGTAIGAAVEKSIASFNIDDKGRGKAIIVISDGENHEDNAVEAAKHAQELGIVVSTIGIGSPEGAKIPEVDEYGRTTGFKKDDDGREVVTKLDEGTLKDMAKEGKGIYVRATSADMGISKVYSELRGLSKTTKETWRFTTFTPVFHWLVAAAILLLILEVLLPEGKRNEINARRS